MKSNSIQNACNHTWTHCASPLMYWSCRQLELETCWSLMPSSAKPSKSNCELSLWRRKVNWTGVGEMKMQKHENKNTQKCLHFSNLQALHPAHCFDQGWSRAAGVHWAVHPSEVDQAGELELEASSRSRDTKKWPNETDCGNKWAKYGPKKETKEDTLGKWDRLK